MSFISQHQLLLKPLAHVIWRDARPSSLGIRQAMSPRARGSGIISTGRCISMDVGPKWELNTVTNKTRKNQQKKITRMMYTTVEYIYTCMKGSKSLAQALQPDIPLPWLQRLYLGRRLQNQKREPDVRFR